MRPAPWAALEITSRSTLQGWAARHGLNRPPTVPFQADPHLGAAIDWLNRSQDVGGDGGSAKAWSLLKGWLPSYPETSGYIVPTLYDAAAFLGRPELRLRAERMARFLLAVQLPDGGVQGDHVGVRPQPIVFNTGQNIFGLLRAWKECGDHAFLDGAFRAGEFLLRHQDPDGAWRTHAYGGIPHAYHARVAWPLLLLARATSDARFEKAGHANLDWVLSQRNATGWFAHNGFHKGQWPNTHGIAYVTQSMIEAFALTGDVRYRDAGLGAVERLLGKLAQQGFIAGLHDESFGDAARWECVTGNIQTAITALRIYQIQGDRKHLDQALALLAHVRRTVGVSHRNPGIRGAIPGSWPIWGRYAPMQYPNWATKFWADALMLADALVRRDDGTPPGPWKTVLEDRYNG